MSIRNKVPVFINPRPRHLRWNVAHRVVTWISSRKNKLNHAARAEKNDAFCLIARWNSHRWLLLTERIAVIWHWTFFSFRAKNGEMKKKKGNDRLHTCERIVNNCVGPFATPPNHMNLAWLNCKNHYCFTEKKYDS